MLTIILIFFLLSSDVGVKVAFVAPSWLVGQAAVVLQDTVSDRILPIFIGDAEARAIQFVLDSVKVPRPMTHDLMVDIIKTLDGKIEKVVVTDLKNDTYFAKIHITKKNGKKRVIDARPSDAINLALRFEAPIYLKEKVFEKEEKARKRQAIPTKPQGKKPKVGDI